MICIRRSAAEALISHARAEAPRECCGLLVGQPGLVERIVPATNVRASETSYLIDPRDHFAAIRAARAEGLSVIGGYHSHPRSSVGPSRASGPSRAQSRDGKLRTTLSRVEGSQALPSATDLADSAGQDFLYVIAAPAARGGWRLGAFFIDTRNFVESPLVPVA